MNRGQLQAYQQPGIQYQHEGANQDTHDMHGQQAINLGRQRAYTGIRSLPIEGHVKKRSCFQFGQLGRAKTVMELMIGFRYLYGSIHSNVPLVGKHSLSME